MCLALSWASHLTSTTVWCARDRAGEELQAVCGRDAQPTHGRLRWLVPLTWVSNLHYSQNDNESDGDMDIGREEK